MKRVFLLLLLGSGALSGCHQVQGDMSDSAIKARILRRFEAQPGVDLSRVAVDVTMGEATLSGIVRSEDERDLLRRIARRTDGVQEVNLNLFVQP